MLLCVLMHSNFTQIRLNFNKQKIDIMDLKDRFETETGQGIAFNEGREPEETNGTYNDAYVEWLENLILFGVNRSLKGKYKPTFEEFMTNFCKHGITLTNNYTKETISLKDLIHKYKITNEVEP